MPLITHITPRSKCTCPELFAHSASHLSALDLSVKKGILVHGSVAKGARSSIRSLQLLHGCHVRRLHVVLELIDLLLELVEGDLLIFDD